MCMRHINNKCSHNTREIVKFALPPNYRLAACLNFFKERSEIFAQMGKFQPYYPISEAIIKAYGKGEV